jgi:heptosyltransferase-2
LALLVAHRGAYFHTVAGSLAAHGPLENKDERLSELITPVGTPARGRRRYLIVRTAGIGDVVLASTLLARITDSEPNAEVRWLCGSLAAPLAARFEGVADVIAFDERRVFRGTALERLTELMRVWRRIGLTRYDAVFLVHVDPRYRALVLPALGSRIRVLQRGRTNDPNPIPGRFFGNEFARLYAPPGNHGPIVDHWPFARLRGLRPAQRSGERPLILMVPGGARNALRDDALRRWPIRSYALLAERLIAAGCDVELIGAPSDEWVRPAFEGVPVADRIGAFSLIETVERLRDADVVVTHDTGPLHLARLVGAPLVAIFGPTLPANVINADENATVITLNPRLACQPCFDGRNFADCRDNVCMSRIGVDEVLSAALTQVAARRAGRSPVSTPG